jgi:hypothetical protein
VWRSGSSSCPPSAVSDATMLALRGTAHIGQPPPLHVSGALPGAGGPLRARDRRAPGRESATDSPNRGLARRASPARLVRTKTTRLDRPLWTLASPCGSGSAVALPLGGRAARSEPQARACGHHWRPAHVDGGDDLLRVDPLELDHPGSRDCALGRGSAACRPRRDVSCSVTAVLIGAHCRARVTTTKAVLEMVGDVAL